MHSDNLVSYRPTQSFVTEQQQQQCPVVGKMIATILPGLPRLFPADAASSDEVRNFTRSFRRRQQRLVHRQADFAIPGIKLSSQVLSRHYLEATAYRH